MNLLNYYENIADKGAFDNEVVNKCQKSLNNDEREIVVKNKNALIREAIAKKQLFADADEVITL